MLANVIAHLFRSWQLGVIVAFYSERAWHAPRISSSSSLLKTNEGAEKCISLTFVSEDRSDSGSIFAVAKYVSYFRATFQLGLECMFTNFWSRIFAAIFIYIYVYRVIIKIRAYNSHIKRDFLIKFKNYFSLKLTLFTITFYFLFYSFYFIENLYKIYSFIYIIRFFF